jgi:valine--pyruvate aminotransferase
VTQWSSFGEKMQRAADGGIVRLMRDLGGALEEAPELLMLGGGNPAVVPAVQAHFDALWRDLTAERSGGALLAAYQDPQGDRQLRRQLAALLSEQYGWALSERNILLCQGSQSAFFLLFNLLGGACADGRFRSIHLPLVPEYVGYADAGFADGLFTASRPQIELIGDDAFKYRLPADLVLPNDTAALCISRPCNPSGNVLTDVELLALHQLAVQRDVPLIIDGAYGLPFPGLCYQAATPFWAPNVILLLSLSKLGLPGLRTGIVVAEEGIIATLGAAATVAQLAPGNAGSEMLGALLRDRSLLSLGARHLVPYYREQIRVLQDALRRELAGVPHRIHLAEGGMFVWLWLPGLPVSTSELYLALKADGLLVVPGEHFFIGGHGDWPHAGECLRLSCAQESEVLVRAAKLLGRRLRALAYG